LYAQNDLAGLARYGQMAVKYLGLLIALPIGLLCGLARPLLIVWLGPGFSDLSWLVVVLVSHLCINLAITPLFGIQEATNHVRLPGVLTLVMGLANVGLAVALALWSGWGFISIAISGAIVLTAKNAIFTPLYAARILKLPWHTFLRSVTSCVLGFVIVGAITFALSSYLELSSWIKLGAVIIIISGLYLPASFFIGLGKDERLFLINEIYKRIRR
jgi:membrane protein EpsK